MSRITEGVLPLVARILMCGIFIPAAIGKSFDWQGNAAYMRAHGMPLVPFFLGAALIVEVVGPLCLIAGYRARLAALVMALYLVPVSFIFHPITKGGGAQTGFLKNVGIIGGLLMITAFGAGTIALDARRRHLQALNSPPAVAK
jgi:putative oxidoreductase